MELKSSRSRERHVQHHCATNTLVTVLRDTCTTTEPPAPRQKKTRDYPLLRFHLILGLNYTRHFIADNRMEANICHFLEHSNT